MSIMLKVLEGTTSGDQGVRGTLNWDVETSDLNAVQIEPVQNVTVQLRDGADAIIGTTVTDASGAYAFEGTFSGNFTVELVGLGERAAGVTPSSAFDYDTGVASSMTASGAWVQIDALLFHQTTGGVAYNTTTIDDFAINQPLRNIASFGRLIRPENSNSAITDRSLTTGLPIRIEPGETRIQMFFSRSFTSASNPVNGQPFVIRHNLPATYTVQPSITHTDVSPTRITTIAVTGTWRIDIIGPEGDFPDGWFIEVMQQADEAIYDDTSLDTAVRYFQQEYLDELQAANPNHLRFMDMLLTNNDIDTITPDDATSIDMYNFDNRMPIELVVALCNYLDCGMWWTTKTAANDALVLAEATYVANNLNPHLRVYQEYSNEVWNGQFTQARWCAAAAIKRYGNQGAGTVSVVRNNATITGVGTNFDQVFGPSPLRNRIVIGDLTYDIDLGATITAEEMSTVGFSSTRPRETLTDTPYWVATSNDLWNGQGQTIFATKHAKIWGDHFASVGQRHRLSNVLGTRQVSASSAQALLDAVEWTTEPDYIDPKTQLDAIATTGYFYAGIEINASTGFAIKNKVSDLKGESRQAEINTMLKDLFLNGSATVDAVTYTNPRPMSFMTALFSNSRGIADQYGMKVLSYEGTDHSIQSNIFAGATTEEVKNNILNAWTDFYQSSECTDVYNAWAQAHVDHLDGPVMQYVFMGPWSEFGFWGSRTEYGYAGDSRTGVLDTYSTTAAWWYPKPV